MINLAGNKQADERIQEELNLANIDLVKGDINVGEVPYTITGKLGNWIFKRAWSYWIARAPDGKGLTLEIASSMHEQDYPITELNQPKKYGEIIRVTGNCTSPHPNRWALPSEIEMDVWSKTLENDWREISYGNLAKLCNEGSIPGQRFVNLYHIDTQLGLNELSRVIREKR